MPWKESSPMDQKIQLSVDYQRHTLSISELSQLYGVSRRTVYKWIDRYLKHGPDGLRDRSRKPVHSPRHTPEHIVSALLEARTRHPSWGPKKLLPLLAKRYPINELPARTTAFEILGRHGMIAKKRRRRTIGHPGKPTSSILAPNDLWCADFKGHFKTRRRPLLLSPDHHRWTQPLPACLPGTELHRRSAGQARLHPRVQRIRLAQAHPYRQRRALRHQHPRQAIEPVCMVDSLRRDARTHRARQAAAKRPS
jgi:transposase